MKDAQELQDQPRVARRLGFFEKYLTLWVLVCIGIGILLGKAFPGMGEALDRISVAQVSIPIAICLFFRCNPSW
jgi:ACR3 family arsenite transporter